MLYSINLGAWDGIFFAYVPFNELDSIGFVYLSIYLSIYLPNPTYISISISIRVSVFKSTPLSLSIHTHTYNM